MSGNGLRLSLVLAVSAVPTAVAIALRSGPTLLVLSLALSVALALSSLFYFGSERIFDRAGGILVALALTCFAVTLLQELVLGGTPLSGKVDGHAYYVGSHGTYHLVSALTYHAAMLFNLGMAALWPALFVFGVLKEKQRRRPKKTKP